MNVTFVKRAMPDTGAVLVLAAEKAKLLPSARSAGQATGGQIAKALKATRFAGGAGETIEILAPAGHQALRVPGHRLRQAGSARCARRPRSIGGGESSGCSRAARRALTHRARSDRRAKAADEAELAAHIGFAAVLESYAIRSPTSPSRSPSDKPTLAKITIATDAAAAARQLVRCEVAVAEGVALARDLVRSRRTCCFPPSSPSAARSSAELGVKVEVLGDDADEAAEDGLASWRRPRQRARVQACRDAMERRRENQEAGRLCRQGRDLRYRRHLDQAGGRHGGHERRYGRRRRCHGHDAWRSPSARPR